MEFQIRVLIVVAMLTRRVVMEIIKIESFALYLNPSFIFAFGSIPYNIGLSSSNYIFKFWPAELDGLDEVFRLLVRTSDYIGKQVYRRLGLATALLFFV